LHDTILNTPDVDSLQIKITKELCPGDSFDLQQINLCLEQGKENSELLSEAKEEIEFKDLIIENQLSVIAEDSSKIILKDQLISD